MDPRVYQGVREGVAKHEDVLVAVGAIAAVETLILGAVAAVELGAIELGAEVMSAGQPALQAFGRAVFVQTGRAAVWFTELSLAEQGLAGIGGGGAGTILFNEARALKGGGGGGGWTAARQPLRELVEQRKVAEDILLEVGARKARKFGDLRLLQELTKLFETEVKPLEGRENLSQAAGRSSELLLRAKKAFLEWSNPFWQSPPGD